MSSLVITFLVYHAGWQEDGWRSWWAILTQVTGSLKLLFMTTIRAQTDYKHTSMMSIDPKIFLSWPKRTWRSNLHRKTLKYWRDRSTWIVPYNAALTWLDLWWRVKNTLNVPYQVNNTEWPWMDLWFRKKIALTVPWQHWRHLFGPPISMTMKCRQMNKYPPFI